MSSTPSHPRDRLSALLERERNRLVGRTPGSRRIFESARGVLAGGVASSFQAYVPYPIYLASGRGARVRDADGQEFIDFFMGAGAMVIGHAHPRIQRVLHENADFATHLGAPSLDALPVASELARRFSLPTWRFCNTGTEATMAALRLARAATGRQILLKILGAYNGHHDAALVPPAREGADRAHLATIGLAADPETLQVPFNDVPALESVLASRGREIACLMIELPMFWPFPCLPTTGYVRAVRRLTREHGVLLVLDEVKSGVTIAAGGATELFDADPDIVTLAKAIGGGLPAAAVGASRGLMERVARGRPPMYGTFNANPLSMAACMATLTDILTEEAYTELRALGDYLSIQIRAAVTATDLPVSVFNIGPKGGVCTAPGSVSDYWQWERTRDDDLTEFVWLYLLNRGIYLAPNPRLQWTLSLAHTQADADLFATNFRAAAEELTRVSWSYQVACDVGGTFTDLAVRSDESAVVIFKAPTTIDDGGLGGVEAALVSAAAQLSAGDVAEFLGRVDQFVFATTKALNAVLERTTPPVAFLTTRGHRDILSLREGGKPSIHSHALYPAPLVPRRLTFEISERIEATGRIRIPLEDEDVRDVLAQVAASEAEAVAVCLLWATVDSRHEERIGSLLDDCLPDLPYTLSHRANPIIREYRRACATVIDASLKPLMTGFFAGVEHRLKTLGLRARVLSATSAGTMLPLADVAAAPVHVVHCGPALAPVGGLAFESSLGDPPSESLVVVDAGGTSFDVSFVHDGEVALTSEHWLGGRLTGHLLGLPVVDVVSIGSGGGSIARVDPAGLVCVGPLSAGADPGPACYGRGGSSATITDAAVVLGLIDPGYFLGGAFPLHAELARAAVAEHVAAPAGLAVPQAAATVLSIADRQMSDAIEGAAINYGIDLGRTTLVAGGGSCGISIDHIAAELGCPRVLIPLAAAALSACGGIFSDVARDFRASANTTTDAFDLTALHAVFDTLRVQAEGFLDSLDMPYAERRIRFYLEARYVHQRWEIEIPFAIDDLCRPDFVDWMRARFDAEHERLYGVSQPGSPIETVAMRVRPSARSTRERAIAVRGRSSGESQPGRQIYLDDLGWLEARIIRGALLSVGDVIEGPAVLEEPATTILIRPGSTLEVASGGVYLLRPHLQSARRQLAGAAASS